MPYKLSPSVLKLLKDCPRCFWLHVNKKIKRPAGIFPSLPSGMDKILKAHFDSYRDKKAVPPELHELKGIKLFDNVELLNVWANNRKGITIADKEGNVIGGAVDYILVKGNKLIVLDFKTRGFPLKEDTADLYQNQLDIYNLALQKNGYKTEDYAYLMFYYPEEVDKTGHVKFHIDLVKMNISVKNAESIFKNAIKILKGKMPPSAENCDFCKWQKLRI